MSCTKIIHCNLTVTLILILIFFWIPAIVMAQANSENQYIPVYMIDNFEDENVGDLPVNWYNQKGEKKTNTFDEELRNTYNYSITEEDGNKFLRFQGIRGKHLNFPLINKDDVNIYETPVLTWKWRIRNTPDGASEDDKNDVAASIYVVYDMGRVALFKKVPKSIRYTWSSSLPVGTELSKFFNNQKIVVVGSGEEQAGEWITFERNIVEDYKRLFGDEPPAKPLAILILSDGDTTNSLSSADYDDIYLKPESE